ncbi:fungal-specific transcription factor domain-containing protein [Phaeosphaeria sp. MPI-PUGE-AT-0046c]|nr:fungal-specific transcription factor domain-containing protein [Phaeosphaeria sp. MPI-PUGE-AT-0046c]
MGDQRENKRVRQACENCRRKKTRCSGERPVCSFCARLKQDCRYNDSFSFNFGGPSNESSLQEENAGLATRVALLESRLSLMDATGANAATVSNLFGDPYTTLLPQSLSPDSVERFTSSDLTFLLDANTLKSLADVYFSCCHKQMYAFFHEETFRQNLENESLPSYILLTFAATAVRFSKEPCFAGRQAECRDTYAKLAWDDLMQYAFSESYNMDVSMVQAAALLGIIDFISGRENLAWVKFGLATRFAQTLELGKENTSSLFPHEAEERRQTFWSVYILDKLGSCGRNRPPALLDSDCTSRLPLNEDTIHVDSSLTAPTLEAVRDIPKEPLLSSSDHFALTVFMISVYGDVVQWAFRHGTADTRLPWDARSKFAHIQGLLNSFESYSDACDGNFAEILERDFVSQGTLDERAASHFSCAHVHYHINQCLLHHPFILRKHLKSFKVKAPVSFFRGALAKSQQHANHLTSILQILQRHGCQSFPSFYGYAAGLAGFLHRLHARGSIGTEQWVAEANWQSCVQFLDQEPLRWESYRRISEVLKDFDPTPELATSLLTFYDNALPLEPAMEEYLWLICEYGWLTNPARRPSSNDLPRPDSINIVRNPSQNTSPEQHTAHSPDFESLLEGALSFDFDLLSQIKNRQNAAGV